MAATEVWDIHDLVRIERMLVDAYDAALDKIDDEEMTEPLSAFREAHDRHAQTLRELEAALPGLQDADGDVARYANEVLDAVSEATNAEAAIGELRIAEAALQLQYTRASSRAERKTAREELKACADEQAEYVEFLGRAGETGRK